MVEHFNKDTFEVLSKFGNRQNVLFGKEIPSIIYLSYNFVKIELPDCLSTSNIPELLNVVAKECNITQTEVKNEELLSFILWIKDELEAVYNLEKENLTNPPDPELIAAGVNELDKLGEINTIDTLAGGDILKWEKVKKLPYHMVFDKMLKNTIEAKVNKAYQKIISKKK